MKCKFCNIRTQLIPVDTLVIIRVGLLNTHAHKFFRIIVDPLGQPTVKAGRDHCFRKCCPSVRQFPLFKSSKTKQQKTMFATGETVGLAEGIIADTCPVHSVFKQNCFFIW